MRLMLRMMTLGLAVCGGSCVQAQQIQQNLPAEERKALDDFWKRADAYMRMEHGLPAAGLKPNADVAELERQRLSLRSAIQHARRGAKQGDVFTPDAAAAFRDLFVRVFAGPDGEKVRASLSHAEPQAPAALAVNKAYPNTKGEPVQSVPPSVLHELPALPKGLEYRIGGRTLSLRDQDANLVVDYLPNALP